MKGVYYMSREFLSRYTSLGVGGEADVTIVKNTDDLCYKSGDTVIGRGTNVLVSDEGVRGRVLVMRNVGAEWQDCRAVVESGTPLAALAREACSRGAGGLEWATGIPGSLGGAIAMNAGAYGGETGNVVEWVTVLTERGEVTVGRQSLRFGYRSTAGLPSGIILRAGLVFGRRSAEELTVKSEAYDRARRASQPYGRTAGSTFKRVGNVGAGYYIDKAGLKGFAVGGARISEKHANFILTDGASAADCRALIDMVKLEVYAREGVKLQEEIKYVGEF